MVVEKVPTYALPSAVEEQVAAVEMDDEEAGVVAEVAGAAVVEVVVASCARSPLRSEHFFRFPHFHHRILPLSCQIWCRYEDQPGPSQESYRFLKLGKATFQRAGVALIQVTGGYAYLARVAFAWHHF